MKILHTSDWHLGHTLYGYDRDFEQRDMLRQIERIVRGEQPDALLISGDVYHTAQPSASTQRLFSETMVRLHDACPRMTIVATAGNHDSGSRHEIFRTPWEALKVYTIGNVDKEHLDNMIVTVPDKGFVIAVPYFYSRNQSHEIYQQLLDKVGEMNTQQLPVVMMAHTTIIGSDFTGHDHSNDLTIGGIDAYSISDMGEGYDYLALGHIHHAQWVQGGNHRVRYAGTPLAVSFDEAYNHSVSIVEIDKHGDTPQVKEIEIVNPRPLVTLPAKEAAEWEKALGILKDFKPERKDTYIRLNVKVEGFLPTSANDVASKEATDKHCCFCYINTQRITHDHQENQKMMTISELHEAKPDEIAKMYVEDLGDSWDDDLAGMFAEAVRKVDEEKKA